MVYPPRRRCFLSQKARKGASKSRAERGCFLCGNVSTNNLRACEAFWHREVQLFEIVTCIVDVFSRKKHKKELQKAARGAVVF